MQPLIISTKARGLIEFSLSFKLTPSVLSLSCWPLNFPFSYSNWGHIIESCHSSCWGWGGGSSNTIWGWVRFAPGGRGKRIEKILKEAPAGISSAFLLHLPAEETFLPACKAHSRFCPLERRWIRQKSTPWVFFGLIFDSRRRKTLSEMLLANATSLHLFMTIPFVKFSHGHSVWADVN